MHIQSKRYEIEAYVSLNVHEEIKKLHIGKIQFHKIRYSIDKLLH